MNKFILNEQRYVEEELLTGASLTQKTAKSLLLLSKYYLYICNKTDEEIKILINDLFSRYGLEHSSNYWNRQLEYAIEYAHERPLINIDYIPITKEEYKIIKKITNEELQKLLFTMICLCRYHDYRNPNNNHWVNYFSNGVAPLFALANVRGSLDAKLDLLRELKNTGYINSTTGYLKHNWQVNVIDENPNSEIFYQVINMDNLGYQWLVATKQGKFCADCGQYIPKYRPRKGHMKTRNEAQIRYKYCKKCREKRQK